MVPPRVDAQSLQSKMKMRRRRRRWGLSWKSTMPRRTPTMVTSSSFTAPSAQIVECLTVNAWFRGQSSNRSCKLSPLGLIQEIVLILV